MKSSVNELQELIRFIDTVSLDENLLWTEPIATGKWSINEIISHIWLWDKYSLEMMLPIISEGISLRFVEQAVINLNAESFARTLTNKDDLIILLKGTRNELIAMCNQLSQSDIHFYVGRHEYNVESYITKFISSHDFHHMEQIQRFIQERTFVYKSGN